MPMVNKYIEVYRWQQEVKTESKNREVVSGIFMISDLIILGFDF